MNSEKTADSTASVREVLRAVARMIASDRRAVVLATDTAEVLLANSPANRLGLDSAKLRKDLDWAGLCLNARRAGSTAVSCVLDGMDTEGELVFMPVGDRAVFLLRLSESEQEAMWLRNRSRAATLMRVAHDLRTPIQSLLVSAESIADKGNRASVQARQLRKAADLALHHIGEVLSVVRGEQVAGGVQPDQVFSLPELLESTIEIIQPMALSRGVDLRVSITQSADYQVTGPVRFVRALCQNMIDNAVKYGGAEVTIRLDVAPLAKALDTDQAGDALVVVLEVADWGGGMPAEHKVRLRGATVSAGHRPEEAQHNAPRPRPSGGMEVIAHAVTQLGGRLEILDRGADGAPLLGAASAVAGTISRATFPLLLAGVDAAADSQVPTSDESDALAGIRLMLVEDSPVSRDWLAHILRQAGAGVTVCADAASALTYLKERDNLAALDLILTDVTLPDMSGIELTRQIVALKTAHQIGKAAMIVGLTAHADQKVQQACRKAGMAQVLEKPIRPATLCRALKDALQENAATTTAEAVTDSAPAAPSPFDASVLSSLMGAFGLEEAKRYMTRALAEGAAALRFVRDNGPGLQAKSMLHAATGACGLTGLKRVEQSLRALELKIEAGATDVAAELAELDATMQDTTTAVEQLHV